jgi:hypothetical protein
LNKNQTQLTTMARPPAPPKGVTPTEGAQVLWAFLYFFIVASEWKLLGGEFGHERCHETLSSQQTAALRQALRTAAEVVRSFDGEAESVWCLAARLSELRDELGRNPTLDPAAYRALRAGLDSAVQEVSRMSDPRFQRNGPSEALRHGLQLAGGRDALSTFKSCAAGYLTGFIELIDAMTNTDGALGRAAVEQVFVCTDTGLGIVSSLKSYLLDHQVSAQEFVIELDDQLRRSAVRESRQRTQLFLAGAARGALVALR